MDGNIRNLVKSLFVIKCWDLSIQYGRNRLLYQMTIANLKKPDLPEEVEELSHEEAVALKDLDPVLQEATMDTLVDELAAEYQTWARSLFILDVEHVMLVSVENRFTNLISVSTLPKI